MPGIPDGLVIKIADLAKKRIGQGRCSARSLKSLERRKARKFEWLDLGHRLNLRDPAISDDAGHLYIFVDQPFYGKNELVIKRRLRVLRQAADADVELIDLVKA